MEHLMNFEIRQFRAIQNANIELNGITVVAGENGCGKSTLSKLLYNTINISHNYDAIIKRILNHDLKDITNVLYSILRDINLAERRSEDNSDDNKLVYRSNHRTLLIKKDEDIADYYERLSLYLGQIEDYILSLYGKQDNHESLDLFYQETHNRYTAKVGRFVRLINNVFKEDIEYNSNNTNIAVLFSTLKDRINKTIEKAIYRLEYRPIDCFINELSSAFSQNIDGVNFNLYELDAPITDWDSKTLKPTNIIQDCVYIDTPMAIGHELSSDSYWDSLTDILRKSKPNHTENTTRELNTIISGNEVISGQVYYDDNIISDGFVYKRNDGHTFDLEECATGIKAFGILQMLLQNGILTKNTLLIIDEPEVHLHPQWIVEYARMIVLLNTELGVKFFIASHNPDMVSAIRYIAEKEGVLDNLNYYLAEKDNINQYTYNYKALGVEIDAIFESFNIALERINQYGVSE